MYAYGTSKDLICKWERTETMQKIDNFDNVIKKNIKKDHLCWHQIPDYLYRILIIQGSGSGKTNSLFNLISYQSDIGKIYLYAKDPYESKYQLLIKTGERTKLKHFSNSKLCFEHSDDINDIYKSTEEYNSK